FPSLEKLKLKLQGRSSVQTLWPDPPPPLRELYIKDCPKLKTLSNTCTSLQ
ncbi:hypothetical protein PanWU01x14_245930, partial [Parasponia andersonii]